METEKAKWNHWRIATILFGIAIIVESFFLYNTLYFKGGSFSLPWGTPVFYDDGDYVSAQGSWISDSSNGKIAEQKINTTDISCLQSRGLCIEARAYKADGASGNLLAQALEYEIKSWTPQEVIAVLDGRAGTIEIRFDRTKKVVTMAESEKAEIEGARALPAYAHLGGGMEAIEASRK